MPVKEFFRNHKLGCETALAFLMTVGAVQILGKTKSAEFLLVGLVFIAMLAVIHVGFGSYSKRRLRYSLFYCVPFAVAFLLGQKVVYETAEIKGLSLLDLLLLVILVAISTLVSMSVLKFIEEKSYSLGREESKKKKARWLVNAAVILACWLPIFLVFFPGLISTDSAVQIHQAIGEGEWSNWHPVLHTAFVAIPMNIGMNIFGDLTAGIAFSTIVQMLLLSGIFGYVVQWVMDLTSRKWIGYALLAFFALCPTVACYAVTMWKDVMFSAVFMLLIVKLYDFIRLKSRCDEVRMRDLWVILLLTLLVGFLRNGGVLIAVGFGVAMLIYYKNARKIMALSFGAIVAVMLTIRGPIYKALNIAKSPFMESMSIPAQQFGYIARNDGLDESTKKELSKYADIECLREKYEAMNADPAKNCFNYEAVEEDKVGLLMLWAKTLPGHLPDYVESYLMQTHAYWYIQGDVWVLDFGHARGEPWLMAEYTDVSLLGNDAKEIITKVENGLVNASWFGWMNSVGVLFWGIWFVLMVFLYQKRYALMIPMTGVCIYMASLLVASPVSYIFRYVYSLMLILPILLIICFIKDKKTRGRKS